MQSAKNIGRGGLSPPPSQHEILTRGAQPPSTTPLQNTIAHQHLRAEIATIFGRNICDSNLHTQYKSIQILRTLLDYIFRILRHFATKLCNFAHFSMLFPGIYFF
jgi:hypothetical protein